MAYPRIYQSIGHINKQIHDHHNGSNQQQARLNNWVIPPKYGIDHPFADTRPRKNGFRQYCTGKQSAYAKTDYRDDGYHCISKRMNTNHPKTRETLCPRCSHVVFNQALPAWQIVFVVR